MVTFEYVEDYIEFIGGCRSIDNKKLWLFDQTPSPLKLARYDVNIISSLAGQTADLSRPYTDKQAELALKLVKKYRKQLSHLPTPVSVPDDLNEYRYPIRAVDRTKRAYIKDDQLVVQFPYDTELITKIKAQIRDGYGAGEFEYDSKLWYLSITESTINWIASIAEQHTVELDDNIKQLYQTIVECEKVEYEIKLVDTGTGYDIINASDSLKEYITNKLGGFGYDNLIALADNASVLGYDVDRPIVQHINNTVSESQCILLSNRVITTEHTYCPCRNC